MTNSRQDKIVQVASITFGDLCWITWLVFLILKVTNVLPETFTWFWVWFPFWLPFALAGVFLLLGVIACLIMAGITRGD